MKTTLIILISLITAAHAAQDLPNILWITSEDNSSNWLGCYGNPQAQTPRLDRLATEGSRFTTAYSNAPVCAVARSTILTGVYAPSQGTQHMRSRHRVPKAFKPYVSYLRELGYYCTNRSKTDFNMEGNDKAVWDQCSGKAHYRNRPKDKPFFAIFNLTTTHESSLFPAKAGKKATRLKPSEISLPPYLPDLPEVRADFARYHDNMTRLDTEIGAILDDLEKAGLAEDTIVFYYADHGGPTPRGKRYLEDTGVRIPMIVRFPEKYRSLSPFEPGKPVDETVAFVDLAPTLLSLCDMEKPSHMQGRAFLGAKRTTPSTPNNVFLYADRFDEIYGMRRGLTDGRWKYIRRFTPHLPAAPYSYYQFSMPGWTAMQTAWRNGKLSGIHQAMWEPNQATEELFDTSADPWEINNLASDPAHAERLAAMRAELKSTMTDVHDTGLIPEPMFPEMAGSGTIHHFANSPAFHLEPVLNLAFLATERDPANLAALKKAMNSDDPIQRYWAIQGCLILGPKAEPATTAIETALIDKESANRVGAAHSLYLLGHQKEAKAALIAELNQPLNDYELQNVVNTITHIGAGDSVPDSWVKEVRSDKKANPYLKRLADRIAESRK